MMLAGRREPLSLRQATGTSGDHVDRCQIWVRMAKSEHRTLAKKNDSMMISHPFLFSPLLSHPERVKTTLQVTGRPASMPVAPTLGAQKNSAR